MCGSAKQSLLWVTQWHNAQVEDILICMNSLLTYRAQLQSHGLGSQSKTETLTQICQENLESKQKTIVKSKIFFFFAENVLTLLWQSSSVWGFMGKLSHISVTLPKRALPDFVAKQNKVKFRQSLCIWVFCGNPLPIN